MKLITSEDIAIAILNFNGAHFLKTFLPSVIANSGKAEIIIIDNASTDDSLSVLKGDFKDLKVIALEKNYGFCGGYNKGIKEINKSWLVLLNSDVEVTENWLLPLLDSINENNKIVAIQPKILSFQNRNNFDYAGASGGFIDTLGYPYCRGRIFDCIEEDNGQYNQVINCFWASGACLLINKEKFWQAGALDEDFFAHMEEIDLCWRLQRLGYMIAVQPNSIVYHVGGGTLSKINPFKTYLNFRNGLELLVKNLSMAELLFIIPIRLTLDWIACVKFVLSKQSPHARAILNAHKDFIKRLSKTIKKRADFKNNNKTNPIRKPFSIVLAYFLLRQKKFNQL